MNASIMLVLCTAIALSVPELRRLQ